MFLQRIFPTRPAIAAGRALFKSAAAQARTPAFYRGGGVADTPEGRFELYALHVVMLLHRIGSDTAQGVETRQALFDAFLRNLDDALREMGVGDLTVPKRMRKLGAAIYGRVKTYGEAGADEAALEAFLARTVLDGAAPERARPLAAYVVEARRRLQDQDDAGLLSGAVEWPVFAYD